jgi:hypothetical protein
MALVRILVDGYSLLHAWTELAPGRSRHSAAAREELIHVLTQYRDACGTPITIVFDAADAPAGTPQVPSTPEVEVLYSKAGQTADQMIERAAYRLKDYGEVLVVTNDYAERDTVTSFGAAVSSCENFIRAIEAEFTDFRRDLKDHNRRERQRFARAPKPA